MSKGIRAQALCKSFGGLFRLGSISVEFLPGVITAIMGPNGSGKTTLFNLITGISKADAGRCFLEGKNIVGWPLFKIAREGLARTFQDVRLVRQMSVQENLLLSKQSRAKESLMRACLGLDYAGVASAKQLSTADLLDRVGLSGLQEAMVGNLSYGQQKLVSLACCLATEAQYVMLDEPIGGLDIEAKAKVAAILNQLRDEGRVVIFIEHDSEFVRRTAGVTIVLSQGTIIAQGVSDDVLGRPEVLGAYL